MKILIIIFSALSFLCCHKKESLSNTIDVKELLTKNKSLWQVDKVEEKQQHYFNSKIDHCFKALIKNIKGKPAAYFLYKKGLCVCIIEEIKFKDRKSLGAVYNTLATEAGLVRKGPRNKFGEICFEPREDQFFYTISKGDALYLLSDGNSYNYRYEGGNDSVDEIIKRDQKDKNELIFDDIYEFIKNH